MGKISIGIVGAGYIGQKEASELQRHPDYSLRWVCDTNIRKSRQLGNQMEVPFFSSFEEAFSTVNVDLVRVATQPQTHYEVAMDALKHGADVYIEKIMTLDATQAEEIVATAEEVDAEVYVRRNAIYTPVFLRAFERRKEIGDVIRVNFTEPIEDYSKHPSDKQEWLRSLPGGIISEHLPHALYLVRWFLGTEPDVASVNYTEESLSVSLSGEVQDGSITYMPSGDGPQLLTVIGTDGVLTVDHGSMRVKRIRRWKSSDPKTRTALNTAYDTYDLTRHTVALAKRFIRTRVTDSVMRDDALWRDARTDHYRQYDDIANGGEFDISGEEGLRNVCLFESIWKEAGEL